MEKKTQKTQKARVINNILITQPRPDSDKSPYFDLERKYGVKLTFQPFIRIEGVPSKEFRKQKIDIAQYTAVIFTSRHSIDHFFRTCEEMRITVSQETKYFCITEAVALYLQKFILYRKRKVFYGADGTNKSMFDVIAKHKSNERFLYPCSENQDNEITGWLRSNMCEFATPILYKAVSNDIKTLLANGNFDIICFFTPGGVKSLFENIPKFKQGDLLIGAFGANTFRAVEEAGLTLQIKAPEPQVPSMSAALDRFLAGPKK
ncbi:MAG: uroporphyrinogen-III synthase [Lacibacter sp.]|jgi:uroporphyrinogen-III synthase